MARLLTSDIIIHFKLLNLWLFVTQPPACQSSGSPDLYDRLTPVVSVCSCHSYSPWKGHRLRVAVTMTTREPRPGLTAVECSTNTRLIHIFFIKRRVSSYYGLFVLLSFFF